MFNAQLQKILRLKLGRCSQDSTNNIINKRSPSKPATFSTMPSNDNISAKACVQNNALLLDLSDRGLNFGHLNIQGIYGNGMCKFSELKALLSANVNIFGLSETKLKEHKLTSAFHIDGYQKPFRKDNLSNGGGVIMVYVKQGIKSEAQERFRNE